MPDILFTGCCETTIGVLDFVAQEFITTETVEELPIRSEMSAASAASAA